MSESNWFGRVLLGILLVCVGVVLAYFDHRLNLLEDRWSADRIAIPPQVLEGDYLVVEDGVITYNKDMCYIDTSIFGGEYILCRVD